MSAALAGIVTTFALAAFVAKFTTYESKVTPSSPHLNSDYFTSRNKQCTKLF